jgi:hypothetical protein
MSYQIGDVVYVKSTEEPVVVMQTRQADAAEFDGKKFPVGYSGNQEVVVVRRPVMSEGGIRYAFFDFLKVELESSDEQTQRLYQKIKSRTELAQADFGEPGNVIAAASKKPH